MTPKKPESTIDQIVAVLREMVSEPMTDQSSSPPTAADVKRVKSKMRGPARKKTATKARARPAAKKKRATTRKKTTVKRVARKKATRAKTTRTKRSKKR